jgi:hypothetical protein
MRTLRNAILVAVVLGVVFFLLQTNNSTLAQGTKLPKPIQIQANAMGTSTQMGRQFHINIYINALSSADDQKALLEAFQAKGNEGLVNAVSKMSGKGRIAIVGTLGYDVNYVRRIVRLPLARIRTTHARGTTAYPLSRSPSRPTGKRTKGCCYLRVSSR